MHWMYQQGPDMFGLGFPTVIGLIPLLVWSLLWKGWALWLAARRGEFTWFAALLVLNTLGLLEIFYIFVIAKQKDVKDTTEIHD